MVQQPTFTPLPIMILALAIVIIAVTLIILGIILCKVGGRNQNFRTDRICIGIFLLFCGIIVIIANITLFPLWPQISAFGVLLIAGGLCYLVMNLRSQ